MIGASAWMKISIGVLSDTPVSRRGRMTIVPTTGTHGPLRLARASGDEAGRTGDRTSHD
jgi:hypothetical protein